MSDICLIQVLDYQAQKHFKKKKVLKCKDYPFKDKCTKNGVAQSNDGVNELKNELKNELNEMEGES